MERTAVEHQTGQDEESRRFVDLAVDTVRPTTNDGVLTYALPSGMDVVRGQVLTVPLRNRMVRAIVLRTHHEQPGFDVRVVQAVAGEALMVRPDQMDAAARIARNTASSMYACAALFLAPGIDNRTTESFVLVRPESQGAGLTAAQLQVVEMLKEHGEITLDRLRGLTGRALTSVLLALEDRGVIQRVLHRDDHLPGPRLERFIRLLSDDTRLTARAPKQAAVQEALVHLARIRRSTESDLIPIEQVREDVDVDAGTLQAMATKQLIEMIDVPKNEAPKSRPVDAPVLTANQAAVWADIEHALELRETTPRLLFGVTGSGKTEIYMRGVAWCLRRGRAAIILVPEIGLATQVVRRFVDRFPGEVVVLHSGQTDSQRYETWQRIAAGEARVVVGPRSSLFAPVRDLGLVVIDEEHESAYKQDTEPRYHARTVATDLARQAGAVVVLGSATPSVESTWLADNGVYRRLELPERVNPIHAGRDRTVATSLDLPRVEIVDTRRELQTGAVGLLSSRLREATSQAIRNHEQAILLLNRRGSSTVVLCRSCGHRLECPHCDIPLVFHRDRRALLCHRCDFRHSPLQACPECHGPLDYFGAGTQRVEDEVRSLWPRARVMRWDQDSIRGQGGFARMLGRVERGEVDVVVGTQMVAKGFDLPKVRVIGVVQADTMLHLPDFRSTERTFQLLTQVAGRAGRRAGGSSVFIQTYTPEHYAIQSASRHDYAAFYEEEIDFRDRHGYPPFMRLIRYVYRHDRERDAAIEAGLLARELARHARRTGIEADLLGPTPAFVAKIRGKYQWQVILRSDDVDGLLDGLPVRPGWTVDVDPQSML